MRHKLRAASQALFVNRVFFAICCVKPECYHRINPFPRLNAMDILLTTLADLPRAKKAHHTTPELQCFRKSRMFAGCGVWRDVIFRCKVCNPPTPINTISRNIFQISMATERLVKSVRKKGSFSNRVIRTYGHARNRFILSPDT